MLRPERIKLHTPQHGQVAMPAGRHSALRMHVRAQFAILMLFCRAARIHVRVYPLFLPLTCLNSISFRQNPFKLSEVSDSSKIAREPTPFGQCKSGSRDI